MLLFLETSSSSTSMGALTPSFFNSSMDGFFVCLRGAVAEEVSCGWEAKGCGWRIAKPMERFAPVHRTTWPEGDEAIPRVISSEFRDSRRKSERN